MMLFKKTLYVVIKTTSSVLVYYTMFDKKASDI